MQQQGRADCAGSASGAAALAAAPVHAAALLGPHQPASCLRRRPQCRGSCSPPDCMLQLPASARLLRCWPPGSPSSTATAAATGTPCLHQASTAGQQKAAFQAQGTDAAARGTTLAPPSIQHPPSKRTLSSTGLEQSMVKVRAFLPFLGPAAAFLPICTILAKCSCRGRASAAPGGVAAGERRQPAGWWVGHPARRRAVPRCSWAAMARWLAAKGSPAAPIGR